MYLIILRDGTTVVFTTSNPDDAAFYAALGFLVQPL